MAFLFGATFATVAQQPEPVVTLRRTACLGTCPVYSVEIFDDGFVRYIGIEFVQYKGEQRVVIPQQAVENLVASFLRANYFALQDSYDTCRSPDGRRFILTDLPTAYTSLRFGKRKKTVRNYICAPRSLSNLEDEIDKVANTRRWIGNRPFDPPPELEPTVRQDFLPQVLINAPISQVGNGSNSAGISSQRICFGPPY